jgi:N-acylneuraminate cytidylyltransferase
MSTNIAIIPARGGSKRIPKKNIVDFNGKPMIAWTIEAAKKSNIFSRIRVSTDSNEIADIAKGYGAEVPFMRDRFADDMAPVSKATTDALIQAEAYWGVEFDTVTQLMANCPLRGADDILAFHNEFSVRKVDYLLSCFKFGWMNPWWAFRLNDQKSHSFLFKDLTHQRSQDLDDLFCPTGSIWMAKAHALKSSNSFHGENQQFCEIDWIPSVDIDDEKDLQIAKSIAAYRFGDQV